MAQSKPLGAPLDGHPAFRASQVDALEAAIESHLAARLVKLPPDSRMIAAKANRFDLPHSSLWFCAYGMPVALRFPEPDHVRVQLHHAGLGATWIGDTLVPVTPNQACISTEAAEFDFAADFEQLVWRIPKDFLIQKLAGLTGTPIVTGLAFDHALDLTQPQATMLMRVLGCVLHATESVGGEHAQIVLAELEQALVSAFLAAATHRYRGQLDRPAPSAAPWQVKRAENYIEANWDKPVTIERLTEVTGASTRSIFRAFQQSRGYTPLEFAKRIRLGHARRMLQEAEGAISVTEVAFACGFADLGRFSKDFAQTYGELPSAVLRRRKDLQRAIA